MALRYGASLADFVYDFGALTDIVDEAGDPTGDQGHAVLVPRPAGDEDDPLITFTVWTEPDEEGVRTQLTELLDHEGNVVDELTVPNDWVQLGQLLEFTVNDGPDGDVWLTTDPENGPYARAMPFTADLFARLALVEERGLSALPDVIATDKATGRFLAVNGDGDHVYVEPAGTGTIVTVAGVAGVTGNVPTAALKTALGAADATALAALITLVQARTYAVCKPLPGGGYEAKPTGWTNAIRVGAEEPASQLADGDIWLRPKTT